MKEEDFYKYSEESKWLEELYMQAPMAIGVYIGSNHIIEFANPLMCELWGRQIKQVLNLPLFEALPEVKGQGFEEILSNVYQSGEAFEGEELPAFLNRNGKKNLYFFNILYKPLKDRSGRITGIIQVAHDVTGLVRSRKGLERNEEILKSALQSGNMGTWFVDFMEGTNSTSFEHDKIYGYKKPVKAWDVEKFLSHVVPEDRSAASEKYNEGIEGGVIDFEIRIKRLDDAIRWVHIKGGTAYNQQGKPMQMSGIITDITSQKNLVERERLLAMAQAEKNEAERQGKVLENLFNEAPALICTLRGRDHTFDFVNPLYQQLFSGRDLKGKPLLLALPELVGQPFSEMLDKVYETGETFFGNEVPLRFDRYNTGEIELGFFNFTYQAHKNSEGTTIGILVFAFEVTEQIEARNLVEKSEQNLKLALEAGNMGTWRMDMVNDITIHSLQHDQIFGYESPVPDWNYSLFLNHVLPGYRHVVEEQFDEAARTGDFDFEVPINDRSNKKKWITVKGKAFSEGGKVIEMAGVVTDITKRKAAEDQLKELSENLVASNEELRAANEEVRLKVDELSKANSQLKLINADMDNFVYTASHDLKAPIANVEGLMKLFVKNISEEDLEKEIVKKIIRSIENSIERFKNTIGELADIAKLQKQVNDMTAISFPEVVHEVELDLQTLIEEAGVKIEKKFKNCRKFNFSYKNLKSVVYNLISNAIKYRSLERKPVVRITCYEAHGNQVLEVKDNGLGIKEKDKQKIFQMYTRLHNHVDGTGVGLYLVKRVIDNAGGTLEVESEEGKGTTFRIALPVPVTA